MIGAALKRLTGTGGVDAFGRIEALRSEIVVAKAEIADLAALPVPRAEAEAALDAALARLGQQGADALTSGLSSLTRPERRPEFAPELGTSDLLALVVALNAQTVRATVGKALDVVYRGRKALPPMAARKAKTAELEAKIIAAEIEEERLIRAVEAAGIPILRRADADPRAVLARIVQ
jgi:hypothetical protein